MKVKVNERDSQLVRNIVVIVATVDGARSGPGDSNRHKRINLSCLQILATPKSDVRNVGINLTHAIAHNTTNS